MTPADEITEALKTLRSPNTTTADLARLRTPIARWLDSWTGIELRETATMQEDARHALAVARAVLGTPDQT